MSALRDVAVLEGQRLEAEQALLATTKVLYDEALERLREDKPQKWAAMAVGQAQLMYTRQVDRVREAEDRLRRAEEERQQDPRWAKRRAEVKRRLGEYYGEYGPHYDLLVNRLVTATVAAEQMEASGRTVDVREFRAITKTVVEAVAALQRYTESQKTEVVNAQVNEGVRQALQVLEEVIAPVQPSLWNQGLKKLHERVQQSA